MKKRIIRMAISLTALVASFLPQNAEAAVCAATCETVVILPNGNLALLVTHCAREAPACGAACVNGIATCWVVA